MMNLPIPTLVVARTACGRAVLLFEEKQMAPVWVEVITEQCILDVGRMAAVDAQKYLDCCVEFHKTNGLQFGFAVFGYN